MSKRIHLVASAAVALVAAIGVAVPASAQPSSGPLTGPIDSSPKQISCESSTAGRIEVHPPGDDGTGRIVGVAKWWGNGSQYTAYTMREVFPFNEEVGRASGPSNGHSVYIPTRVPQSGKYFTEVIYDHNSHCVSQSVQLG